MSESDRQDPEGHEPTEEVGPTASEVDPERAGLKPGQIDGAPQESQVTFQDELGEAFVAEPLTMILSPTDGLPIPAAESDIFSTAPPFSIDNVVCVEDARSFVEMYADELKDALFWRASPESFVILNGERYKPDGTERERLSFAPERVVTLWGQKFVRFTEDEWQVAKAELLADMPDGKTMAEVDSLPFVAVRPVRERCEHYKRQVFSNDDQPNEGAFGHYIVFRNCTERRSVGGAFMSVRDEAVHACDYRSPPHLPSVEKHLDAKDRERLTRKVTRVPLFGIPIVPDGYVPPVVGNPMTPTPNVMVPAVPGYVVDEPTGPRTADAPVLESVLRHDVGDAHDNPGFTGGLPRAERFPSALDPLPPGPPPRPVSTPEELQAQVLRDPPRALGADSRLPDPAEQLIPETSSKAEHAAQVDSDAPVKIELADALRALNAAEAAAGLPLTTDDIPKTPRNS